MDKQQAAVYQEATHKEVQATRRFLRFLNEKKSAGNQVAAFDSMLAGHADGREAGVSELPESLQRIINHPSMAGEQQAVFDGLADGIEEYQRRNSGDMPSAYVVAEALTTAAAPFGGAEKHDKAEPTFDSLSLGHVESTSVVPAATQVVIAYGISNSLPIVSMLPNPMGSNELPIVYGEAIAGMNMGVMRRGDLMDGDKSGMPYLENRHNVVMNKGATGAFSVTSHVAYNAEIAADRTTKFVIDTESDKAPFLGGRVSIMVKGIEIANDNQQQHATAEGKSVLQPMEQVTIGADTYIVSTATANLDTHVVNVQFDITDGAEPEAGDVTVELIFDYDRVDNSGNKILREPSTDMKFLHRSIYAHPSRSKSTASIDAITQLANELGVNWYAAAQTIAMQRYYFEQTGRLLRTAVNMCLSNQTPNTGRLITFDFNTNGVTPTSIEGALSKINMTLGTARTRLSRAINMAIAGYDLYVSDRGAAFFGGMSAENYESSGEAYGDQYSVYRIGRLKTTGANVYYIPQSMGVFNEDDLTTTAHALLAPRTTQPAQAPFVGMTAVPPMVLTSNADAFNKDVAIYSRMAAEVNPIPRFRNQFMLIEMINLPAL